MKKILIPVKNKKAYIIVLLSVCLGFLSYLVHLDIFRNFDFNSLVSIQTLSFSGIDYIFSVFTLLGSSEFILIMILLIFLILWRKRKKFFTGIFLYLLIYPLELLGKLLIYHPKPPSVFNKYVFHFRLPSSFLVSTNFSYPSGHMARCSFLSVVLLYLLSRCDKKKYLKKPASFVVILYFLGMFISRIYLGEHWFSDVLGGALLGWIIGLFSLSLL